MRKSLKKLLLESPVEQREEIVDAIIDWSKAADIKHGGGTQFDQTKDLRSKRRLSKQLWNKYADHNWIQNNIVAFHQLGYAGDVNFPVYFHKYKKKQKNELSAWGIIGKDNLYQKIAEIDGSANSVIDIGLILDGRITWVGGFDAFSEQIKDATEEDWKRHKDSGLPKRPGMPGPSFWKYPRQPLIDLLVLDDEDLERFINTQHVHMYTDVLDEIFIDNWSIKEVIVKIPVGVISRDGEWWEEDFYTVYKIDEICQQSNLKMTFIDTDGNLADKQRIWENNISYVNMIKSGYLKMNF